MTEQELLAAVENDARQLAASVRAAEDAGVSPALVLPSLFVVFREAGMLPENLDLSSIMGMML